MDRLLGGRDRVRPERVAWLAAALLVAFSAPFVAAKPKQRLSDLLWVNPDYSRYQIREIALLPVVTFDNNLEAAGKVERAWGQAFSKSGHRWTSAAFSRERLRAAGGGDSLLKLVVAQVRQQGRVDSASAAGLAHVLRSRALLTVRVENWEKFELDPSQPGRASTTVHLKAAMVDSSGALLWSLSGRERLEGQQYDPSAVPLAMRPGELGNKPVTGALTAAPAVEEVLSKLLGRWAPFLPTPAPVSSAPVSAPAPAAPAPVPPAPASRDSAGG